PKNARSRPVPSSPTRKCSTSRSGRRCGRLTALFHRSDLSLPFQRLHASARPHQPVRHAPADSKNHANLPDALSARSEALCTTHLTLIEDSLGPSELLSASSRRVQSCQCSLSNQIALELSDGG